MPVAISGLPIDGYVPGTTYTVKLTWLEAALRAQQSQQLGLRPSTSLVAEFVAEDGSDSGILELEPSFAVEAELCTRTPSDPPILAATLYSARSIGKPSEAATCSGEQKGERCIIAVRPCGSSELRVRWTAPLSWTAPVWFSAGFVTTDNASGVPNDSDFVTEVVVPIGTASDEVPQRTEVHGGCNVQLDADGRTASAWCVLASSVLALFWIRWRRPRCTSRALSALAMFAIAVTPGCEYRADSTDDEDIGLFTPGYDPGVQSRGAAANDGDADAGNAPASVGVTCAGKDIPSSDAGTSNAEGSFEFVFVSNLPHGEYDKSAEVFNNIGVVWIEDDLGRYVKALEFWGTRYLLSLRTYLLNRRFGCAVDVVAMATLQTHATHRLAWDGKDLHGHVVPDGNYELWIEIQIDERQLQPAVSFPFTKGRSSWTTTVPPGTPLQSLTLTYKPQP